MAKLPRNRRFLTLQYCFLVAFFDNRINRVMQYDELALCGTVFYLKSGLGDLFSRCETEDV